MSMELAQRLAEEAMTSAVSTQGDPLVTLGQARTRMDMATVLPSPPLKLLDEVRVTSIVKAYLLKLFNFSSKDSQCETLFTELTL